MSGDRRPVRDATAGMADPNVELNQQHADFIARHAHGRVLEIGAATGNITRHLVESRAVTSLVAVAPEAARAEHLRTLGLTGADVVVGNVLTAPLSGLFDTVVLDELLGQLTDVEEACLRRRLQGLLRDGASVIITTPVGSVPGSDHVRGFSRAALLDRVGSAYGSVIVHHDNGVQQFLLARWRRPSRVGPRVSVLLPTWNHGNLLPGAIASVLAQTYGDLELVIVDDGSTDRTQAVLEGLADARCRTVRVEHGGLPTALNVATCLARGEFITWTSSDNWCHERWLESLVRALDARTNAAFAFTGFQFVDEAGGAIGDHVLTDASVAGLVCQSPGLASFMYRASSVGEVGFYDPDLALAEDWDYWTRLVVGRDLVYVPEVLYYYRLHPNSLTARETPRVIAAAREVLRRSIHRLGEPAQLERVYPSLAACRDHVRAEADAAWDLGVRLLRSPWADPDMARALLERARTLRDTGWVRFAQVALEGCAGRWDSARTQFESLPDTCDGAAREGLASVLAAGNAAALPALLPTPDERTSELIALERARYVWPAPTAVPGAVAAAAHLHS